MAKKFYVLDSNNGGSRTDKNGNYRLLIGSEIKTFFESQGKKGRLFIFQKQLNGDVIGVEIPKDKQREYKADKNRQEYIKRVKHEMDISIISLENMTVGDDEVSGVEIIPDENADIERSFIENEEFETLQEALNNLTEEEFYIINTLFLSENRMSEREVAVELQVSQQYVNKKKKEILIKLKKYFMDFGCNS